MHKKINYYFKAYEQSCSIVCARGGGGGSLTHPKFLIKQKKGGGQIRRNHANRNPWGEGGGVAGTLLHDNSIIYTLYIYIWIYQKWLLREKVCWGNAPTPRLYVPDEKNMRMGWGVKTILHRGGALSSMVFAHKLYNGKIFWIKRVVERALLCQNF